MNEQLQNFARQKLKDDLALLTEDNRKMFRLLYARPRGKLSTDAEIDAADINAVVDAMPAERLDWAMQQVQNTFKENAKNQQG